MTPEAPGTGQPAGAPSTPDREHLRLLSIFHYVLAALTALFACMPVIHLVLGIAIVTGSLNTTGQEPMPEAFGWMFIAIAAVFILLGWTLAICLAVAGRRLGQPSHYTFCFVVACLSTVFFPLGTALGVFTLIVLSRPSAKALFQETGQRARPT